MLPYFYANCFFLIFVFTYSTSDGSVDFSGSQVLKVFTNRSEVLHSLDLEDKLDIWCRNATHMDIFVPKEELTKAKLLLKGKKINFRTIIEDVQKAIYDENRLIGQKGSRIRGGKRMNWQQYQRLNVIYDYLDELAETYPEFVSVGVIGYSVENIALKYIKISSGSPNARAIFIDGGIHAREWVSTASATYIVHQLVENRGSQPKDIVETDFYILPVVNPDGYEFTHTHNRLWRKNKSKGHSCYGVDLNRNFDFHWGGKGAGKNECSEVYRGRHPASEPETQAFQNFISSIKESLKAYISFHSYGQYILIPYGYDELALAEGYDELKVLAERARLAMYQVDNKSYIVGNTAQILYPAAGGSVDWVKAMTNIKYSYSIELRDKGEHGFILPSEFIIPSAKEAFEAVKVISVAVTRD